VNYFQQMPRIPLTLKIDDRLVEGFKSAARKSGLSLNVYMETLLLGHLKGVGEIPIDALPLGDSRGGKREGAGKPKKSISGDSTADITTDSATDPEASK
jgi:hypothetical protein